MIFFALLPATISEQTGSPSGPLDEDIYMNMSINRRLSPDQWVWMGGNWMVFWKSTSIKSGPSYAGFFLVTKGVFHGGTQQPWHSQECQEHCGLSKWITVQSGVIPQAALLPCMLASCRWARVNPTASDRWDSRRIIGGTLLCRNYFWSILFCDQL